MSFASKTLAVFLFALWLAAPTGRAQDAPAASDEEAALRGAGHYRFLAATTLLGGAEGALFAAAADPDDGEAILASSFLGVAGGFFVPMLLTRGQRVTEAEATLTGYGGLQGLAHGTLLGLLLVDEEAEGRSVAALMGALGIAGSAAGFCLARRLDLRSGPAEAVTVGGLYGTGLGVYAGLLAVGNDGSDTARRTAALGGLAGAALGAYGGYGLGRHAGYTQGDARIFGTAGLVGMRVARTALFVAGGDPRGGGRAASATVLAGALGGLALGHGLLVRSRDFGRAQGTIISLGALAGSLTGGAASLAVEADEKTAAVLGALGTLGGFAGAYLTYRGEAQAESHASNLGVANLDVRLAPGRALEGGAGGPMGDFTPALNVRLSF